MIVKHYDYEWDPDNEIFTIIHKGVRHAAHLPKGFLYYPFYRMKHFWAEQAGTDKVFKLEPEVTEDDSELVKHLTPAEN